MITRVLKISPTAPDPAAIAEAADVIQHGGLVAFPTETVYGLGANALDAEAVGRIFAAKGRPGNNPVIVHVNSLSAAQLLAADWTDAAQLLAERFWPGPLTLVVKKRLIVPEITTAGGDTVAIRSPQHPIARALIEAAGVPLAAPSANISNRVSATTAEHVLRTLDGRIDMLLDGGPAGGGIESTVVDATTHPVRVLRLGLVTVEQLQSVLDEPVLSASATIAHDATAPSPGMLKRHYAPTVPLEVVDNDAERVAALTSLGHRVGWLAIKGTGVISAGQEKTPVPVLMPFLMPEEAAEYARVLYQRLYELEAARVDWIVVARPPETADWAAIHDRLRRASASES